MSERYCNYCQKFKADEGFKSLKHPHNGAPRSMCPPCQDIRKRPRSELAAMARKATLERKPK